ncbi:MAG: hypothetical protein J6Y85_02645 [Alphaproteobacteria bacterium]|nr:hypothetical protein [Alphaproteobacteria bacterium]
MKKNIFVLALSLTFATAAHAETTIEWTKAGCESVGGTWITAHSPTDSGCDAAHCNGLNFCQSPQKMNWFSALIWCKSIGHKLVSFEHLCPGIPTAANDNGPCTNIKSRGVSWGWTNLPSGSQNAFTVELVNGHSHNNAARSSASTWAVCEQ